MYSMFSTFKQLHITPVLLQAMEKASSFLFPLTDICTPYVYFNPMLVNYLVALLTGPREVSLPFCASSTILKF